MSNLLAYLKLLRAPNGFTAIADIAMGFVLAASLSVGAKGIGGDTAPWGAFLALAIASWCLYSAGMVLNDVFDLDIDRQERPGRPLPSGQVPLGLARSLGFGLLAIGVVWALLAGIVYGAAIWWRPVVVALLLAGSVLLYDGGLKKTWAGPIGMGLCRFFNVLLGMSFAATASSDSLLAGIGYGPAHLLPAAGIGLYIVGVTWFARQEATTSGRLGLTLGFLVMLAGIGVLYMTSKFVPTPEQAPLKVGLLLVLLLISIARRAIIAISNPTPKNVQVTIKHSIFSLVLFDAAITLLVAPWFYAVAIVALLVPMLLLGKWIYST